MTKKISFQRQLTLAVTGVISFSVITLSLISYFEAKNRITENVINQIDQLSGLLSNQVHNWISSAMEDAQVQAERNSSKNIFKNPTDTTLLLNANQGLKSVIDHNTRYQSLRILNDKGDIIAASEPELIGKFNYKDRDYFVNAMKGSPTLSSVVIGKSTGKPVVVAASPIIVNGKTEGVLSIVIILDRLTQDVVLPVHIGKGGYAYITNDQCLVISHPKPENLMKTNICELGFGKTMMEQKNGVHQYTFKSVEKTAAYKTEELTRWLIVVTADKDDLTSSVIAIRNKAILFGIVFLILGWIIARLIARSVILKLGKDPSEISELVELVSAGNLKIKLDETINFGVYNKIKEMLAHLQKKEQLANFIAMNDLTHEAELASPEDGLGIALKKMSENLKTTIDQVSDSIRQIESGSTQVSSASVSLSQGATEQAASLEEISSSMTEIGSQTKSNADNAAQANVLAIASRQAAEKGRDEIKSTVTAMTEINQSSQQIAKIIKVIDDIAFQTNLLALNAAVESARAGKHGKGFAVVADEVRNLASRSALAAKETETLIENSGKKVEAGLLVVQRTSVSFNEILSNAVKVADIISEISAASNAQAEGVAQVATALSQIDQVTQQNTANAEETASAAEELLGQTQELRSAISQFKLK